MKAHIIILAVCMVLAACGEPPEAHAQNDGGVVTHEAQPGDNDPNYWTEERMRNAKPMEKTVTSPDIRACTEEAKICPDGSAVGRTAPNCEFALCPDEQIMCTQDAKGCPDGSFVGRTGPNCEFAPCPGTAGGYNPNE